jgi:hypothetical protein
LTSRRLRASSRLQLAFRWDSSSANQGAEEGILVSRISRGRIKSGPDTEDRRKESFCRARLSQA